MKKNKEIREKMRLLDFFFIKCKSCGLGASIAAFCPVDSSSNPLNSLTLFQLGSGVTLPTGGGPLWPASVLSVIKPLKDY